MYIPIVAAMKTYFELICNGYQLQIQLQSMSLSGMEEE